MKCPRCQAETSDMMTTCELCGASLFAAPQQPVDHGMPPGAPTVAGPVQAGEPPEYSPRFQAPAAGQPTPPYQQPPQGMYQQPPQGMYPQPPPGGPQMPAPGDASYYTQARGGPGGPPPQGSPPPPWYMRPWPYVAAIVLVVAIIGGVLAFGSKGAGAYPELVEGNLPTVLDVYTDT
jgi:hypothetical protein